MKRGLFITVEGGEGVGKSTFIKALEKSLVDRNVNICLTREPGGSQVGEAVRNIFNHPPGDEALTVEGEMFLLAAARAQHVEHRIQPELKRGSWVVCDRFSDSSLVYQSYLGGLEYSLVETICLRATKGLVPDITFLLDCDVEVAASRLKMRKQKGSEETRYDKASLSMHEKIRESFLDLSRRYPNRICVLDASQSSEKVILQAIHFLESRHFHSDGRE